MEAVGGKTNFIVGYFNKYYLEGLSIIYWAEAVSIIGKAGAFIHISQDRKMFAHFCGSDNDYILPTFRYGYRYNYKNNFNFCLDLSWS